MAIQQQIKTSLIWVDKRGFFRGAGDEEIGEAPPVAEKASRFRGSDPIGGPKRGRESADTTVSSRVKRKKRTANRRLAVLFGAGDEARTRYLDLGKVALYQMSYARKMVPQAGVEPATRGFSVRCSTN